MPAVTASLVSPAWAAAFKPSIADNRYPIASLDMALLALVAGRWATYDPYPGEDDLEQVVRHLKAMRDGQPDPRAIVKVTTTEVTAGLGARGRSTVEGMILKARHLLNDGEPVFSKVELLGNVVAFTVAPNRALVTAHRAFGRMMRGRATRGMLTDRVYSSLQPDVMARFSTGASSPVYARARSWLHSPGDAGLPHDGVEWSDEHMRLRMTVPVKDVARRLGLWCRPRPSAVDAVLQHVARDLFRIGYHVSVEFSGDEATVVLAGTKRAHEAEHVEVTPDPLGIVPATKPGPGGRFRPVSARARRAAAAATAVPAPIDAVVTVDPQPPRRTRMGAAIVSPVAAEPAILHENYVEYFASTSEPVAAPDLVTEPPPVIAGTGAAPRPVFRKREYAPPVVPVPAPDALVVEWGDCESGIDPHDGWGFCRDMEGEAELWRSSEGLAHLDSHGDGYDFDAPPPGAPYLPLPTEYTNGPATGPDRRPPWLVRHLSYRVSWWPGAWADRSQSAFAPTAGTPIEPYAVWAPGMGAQPAHVTCLADIETYKARAWRRSKWIEIRSEIAHLEEEGVDPDEVETLRLDMDRVGYDALDEEFGGQGMEPWDAHIVPPSMSPRDRYYSDLVTARRLAARRAENAAKNARYEAEKAAKAGAPV